MIVPDLKLVVGALFNAVVHGGESISMSVGSNGGCVPTDTQTLK